MLSSFVLAALAATAQTPSLPPSTAPTPVAASAPVVANTPTYYTTPAPSHRWSGGLFSRWSGHGSGCHGGAPVVVASAPAPVVVAPAPVVTTYQQSHASHFSSRQSGHLALWWQNWQSNFRSHFHHGNGCTGGNVYSAPTSTIVTPAPASVTPEAAKPLPSGVPTAPAPDAAPKKASVNTNEPISFPLEQVSGLAPTILPINIIDTQKQGVSERPR